MANLLINYPCGHYTFSEDDNCQICDKKNFKFSLLAPYYFLSNQISGSLNEILRSLKFHITPNKKIDAPSSNWVLQVNPFKDVAILRSNIDTNMPTDIFNKYFGRIISNKQFVLLKTYQISNNMSCIIYTEDRIGRKMSGTMHLPHSLDKGLISDQFQSSYFYLNFTDYPLFLFYSYDSLETYDNTLKALLRLSNFETHKIRDRSAWASSNFSLKEHIQFQSSCHMTVATNGVEKDYHFIWMPTPIIRHDPILNSNAELILDPEDVIEDGNTTGEEEYESEGGLDPYET